MSKLPTYFESQRERGVTDSGLFSFAYNEAQKLFLVGEADVPLAKFNPHDFWPEDLGIEAKAIAPDAIIDHPLVISETGALVAGPRFHDWAHKNPSRLKLTAEMMRETFNTLAAYTVEEETVNHGHLGFGAGVTSQGGVVLHVEGSCAFMGVHPYGLYQIEGVEEGFAEYDHHNTESTVHILSLYAGMGHIARLAAEQ
jgi:hypothetical protein